MILQSLEMTRNRSKQASNPGSSGSSSSQINERVSEIEETLKSGLEALRSQISGGGHSPEVLGDFTLKLESFRTSVMQSVANLKSELSKITGKICEVDRVLEGRQQETFLNNIVIKGLPEEESEDLMQTVLRVINTRILHNVRPKSQLNPSDLNFCRRLGKKSDKHSRPISVQFVNRWMRDSVFTQKKFLKGSGIVVVEQLVKTRLKLFKMVRDKFEAKSCWTWRGNIFVSIRGERKQIKGDLDIANVTGDKTTDK